MNNFELQKLRDLPIEGGAERLGLMVKHHKCLCPFHDDHAPSLSFNVRKNTYRCFVCGAHGGTIDLVMNYLHKDFREATKWLSNPSLSLPQGEGMGSYKKQKVYAFDASRYERFFEHPFLNEAARHFLYEERKIDARVVRWCRLTSWTDRHGIPWLQIPYYDREGNLIGIQNRNVAPPNLPIREELVDSGTSAVNALGKDTGTSAVNALGKDTGTSAVNALGKDTGTSASNTSCQSTLYQSSPLGGVRGGSGSVFRCPRFRFPTGSRCSIYNLPVLNLLKEGEPLYITEGASDCWAMLSSGHKAIAIPSATLLNPQDIAILSNLGSQLSTEFHMFPDSDEPGERLFLELKKCLPNLQHHQLPLGMKDYSDYYVSSRA